MEYRNIIVSIVPLHFRQTQKSFDLFEQILGYPTRILHRSYTGPLNSTANNRKNLILSDDDNRIGDLISPLKDFDLNK